MIYVFLADGFEEIEAVSAVDVLRRAGYNVVTVSASGSDLSRVVNGAHDIKITADIIGEDVVLDNIDAIVLPGGMPGVTNLKNSSIVNKAIDYCNKNQKYIAAICAAPSILGVCGVLEGKRATCFPGFERDLDKANVVNDYICVDHNIITAKGPGVSIKFALEIIKLISGNEKSEEVRKSMQCR